MAAWREGAWRIGAWAGTAWATDETEPQVVVPNVVGLTQVAANSSIVGAGLLFSASTAYSDSVAAGLVISQNPVASTLVDSGDLVTVVVSLGVQPVISVTTPRSRTVVVSRFG
jgi:beta-lactam-binding protein with PASTA domain